MYSRSFQDVDELFIYGNRFGDVALYHLLSNGSSAVNGCRQNESPAYRHSSIYIFFSCSVVYNEYIEEYYEM